MINAIRLENFGMHERVAWQNLRPLNLILGVNGTGKTFILKAMYVAMRTLEQYKRGNAQQSLPDILQEKLHWTFQTDRLGDLVNKANHAKLTFAMTVDNDKSISYEFGRDTVRKILKAGTTFQRNRDSNTIYIPAKEVLSLQDVILKSREQDMMYGFDDTYLDLVKALQLPAATTTNTSPPAADSSETSWAAPSTTTSKSTSGTTRKATRATPSTQQPKASRKSRYSTNSWPIATSHRAPSSSSTRSSPPCTPRPS